jgi:hypothetical protein
VYSIAEPYCISFYSLRSAIVSASRSLYICVSLFANSSYIKNMYLILLFLVVKLLALYLTKYGLNYLSTYPAKNNPV